MSKKISESEILKSVKSQNLSLTDTIAGATWDRALVYQSEIVERWLAIELPQWRSVTEEDLRHFDSQAAIWYATKGDQHYGPVSAQFLANYPHDLLCFSLALKRKARSSVFRTLNLPKPKTEKVFVNRRAPRKLIRHLIPLRKGNTITMAMALDISILGVGLYLRSAPNPGETYLFDFRTFGLESSSEAVVRVEAVSPFKAGLRCGLSFVDLPRKDAKVLEQWLQTL